MTDKTPALPPTEKILPALVLHYSPDAPGPNVSDDQTLIELLQKLPALAVDDHIDPVTVLLKRHEPERHFSKTSQAQVAFVDDAITEFLKQTDLDFRIEAFVRDIAPRITALTLKEDFSALTKPDPLYDLVELVVGECIGWSEDLGILGEQFIEKVAAVMSAFSSGRISVETCITDLEAVFKKEEPLFEKLEQRLCDRELKVLGGKKGQYFSAEFLNKQMSGKSMPLFVIFMFQGPWYDLMQQVFVRYGEKSREWENVKKLTEAMIWSLQPGKDKAKQTDLINNLPKQIRAFCTAMDFNTTQVTESLADLDGEYQAILAGQASDPCDFELLEVDESMAISMQEAAKEAVARVRAVPVGQWFLYDDPTEPDEKVARIKLILNWEDTEQLLLTNHNRRKVVHLSYGEMVNHLESGVLRTLNPSKSLIETFRSHLFAVLKAVSDQNKKEKQIEIRQQRQVVSQQYVKARKEDLELQLAELEAKAEKKKQRALVLRHKSKKKQHAAQATVARLKQDAWVKLPIMEGTLTPCKLVAIIPANHTYIFANRAGIKVAEFTGSQLAHMIVTENSEILDTGAEFESALATVVSGLREDKNKSYDELTGDTD